VKSRKFTVSVKEAFLLGGLILSVFFLFLIFILVEGAKPLGNAENIVAEKTIAPTEIMEEKESIGPIVEDIQLSWTATPRPTVIFEGGDYPTEIPGSPVPSATPGDISPLSLPLGINPLTGQMPNSPELLERRPIASKIAIFPRSIRPVSGVSLADIVFEYYIEGGLTRFIAVFYGNDAAAVGPVRSGRFFDEHIVRMYQSYFVFKFADPRVWNYFQSTDIRSFLIVPGVTSCPPFFVGQYDRDTYNNVFFNTGKFAACLQKKGMDNSAPNLKPGYFSMNVPEISETAMRIYARYSLDNYHFWAYDPSIEQYYRSQEANNIRDDGNTPEYTLFDDALTGSALSTDNLIYLFVPHTFESDEHERAEIYHIDLIGEGDAVLFRNGIVISAYWRRAANDQPLLITDRSRIPLPLKNGRTFYEVIGKSSAYTLQDSQAFFDFETP
jgi:hypothetical protein